MISLTILIYTIIINVKNGLFLEYLYLNEKNGSIKYTPEKMHICTYAFLNFGYILICGYLLIKIMKKYVE